VWQVTFGTMQQDMNEKQNRLNRYVRGWLILGLVLVFGQILIGGVTRLTGSGLSITKWEIITGTLPPMTTEAWEQEFALYKETPQYALINDGMSLSEFKFIYFWEYLHRLWARWMGLVFLIPFLIFWRKGMLSGRLIRQLCILVGLAAVTASFGWIMVASGLIERPWVNAYKLSTHLLLGFSVFLYLLHILVGAIWPHGVGPSRSKHHRNLVALLSLLVFQIFLGGMMSGMKAGFAYPTWPDMHGAWMPAMLGDVSHWTVENFVDYDETGFMVALVQFMHRITAYLLIIIGLRYYIRYRTAHVSPWYDRIHTLWIILLIIQVTLGILTLLGFQRGMPVALGSAHQMVALLLVSTLVVQWTWIMEARRSPRSVQVDEVGSVGQDTMR